MPVTTERLPRSLVALKFEVEQERLEASMGRAVQRVSKQVRIPGFRPGKAPRDLVERTVGRSALLQEALDLLLPALYSETIAAQAIDVIGQPEFELESLEPVIVNVRVPVRPTIDLKDYGSLRAPREPVQSTAERLEQELTALRRRFATLEPVERAVAWGDTVRADVTAAVEGQAEPHSEQDAEFRVEQGTQVSLPGFLEHLAGLERGGPHEFSFALPADFEATELAGKTVSYTVRIHEVKHEVLPELDDDFVQSIDEEGVTSVEQLRERVRDNLQRQLEQAALGKYQDELVDLLVAGAELDYPEVLVERDIDRLLDQQSNHATHTPEELARWLERVGKTEQEVRDALREQADLDVRRGLVLGELVRREQIAITEQDIDGELELILGGTLGGTDDTAEGNDERRAQLRGMFDTPEMRASLRNRLTTQRALDRLTEICSQPAEAVEEAASRQRGTRRRRGAQAAAGGEAAAGDAQQSEQSEQSEQSGDTQEPDTEQGDEHGVEPRPLA
ncbi:MAG: trigger factor [Dehalococcoidia bacterium]|nr:trigger factor [Dehalococcoidia bacterium]